MSNDITEIEMMAKTGGQSYDLFEGSNTNSTHKSKRII